MLLKLCYIVISIIELIKKEIKALFYFVICEEQIIVFIYQLLLSATPRFQHRWKTEKMIISTNIYC